MKSSECGRFVVLDGLHLDRHVFDSLAKWAAAHELRIQDAIQLAVCVLHDGSIVDRDANAPPPRPASSSRGLARQARADSIE